mgnify:FL=1
MMMPMGRYKKVMTMEVKEAPMKKKKGKKKAKNARKGTIVGKFSSQEV